LTTKKILAGLPADARQPGQDFFSARASLPRRPPAATTDDMPASELEARVLVQPELEESPGRVSD